MSKEDVFKVSKEKTKKKDFSQVIVWVASVLIGATIGVLIVVSGLLDNMTGVGILVSLVSLAIWFMLGIVIHELGHLYFGLLTGYKFGFFKLGSLSWFKEDEQLKFKRSKNFAAGQCLMFPPDNEEDFKFILYNLGGVIFNFLTGLALLPLWILLPGDHLLNHIAFTGIAMNVLFGLTNLIPIRSQGNDGANMVEALKSTDGKRAFYLILYVNALRMQGSRLVEIDEDLIRIYGKLDIGNFLVGNVLMYEVEYLLDMDQAKEALDICQAVETDKYPAIHGYLYDLFQLIIYLTYLPDFEKAKAIYEQKQFQTFLKMKLPSITLVLVAYEFLVNNNRTKAEKLFTQAKKEAANLPNKGERLEMFDDLDELEKMMEVGVNG